MSRKKLKNELISRLNGADIGQFPKYSTQIMNLANQNGQGTRPVIVGQLSELFPEYLQTTQNPSIEEWEIWYRSNYSEAIKNAADKVEEHILKLKDALGRIDRGLIEAWLHDLIIDKTYNGMYYQKAILRTIAEEKKTKWRLATPEEESRGIDGFIGDTPVSIKPDTYKLMARLNEIIDVKIVTYSKAKDGIWIEY
ncbi:MAG: MjaI family restriction endonuclease [Erysipelotrichaceae bacterium]